MSGDKPKLTLLPGGLTDEKAQLIANMQAPLRQFYQKLADILDVAANALNDADEGDAESFLTSWPYALAGFRDHHLARIRTAAKMYPAPDAAIEQMMRAWGTHCLVRSTTRPGKSPISVGPRTSAMRQPPSGE